MAIFPKVYSKYNPTKIVATDTNVNQLEFGVEPGIDGASPDVNGPKNHDFRVPLVSSPTNFGDERMTLLIKIVLGTFIFNVGDDPTGNPGTFTVGDTFTVSVHNRVSNLHFKATAIGDSFSVSA